MPPTELRSGQIRVAPYSDYEPGAAGYVIEQADYYGPTFDRQLGWAIPAWGERGEPQFEGVFPTHAAAAYLVARG